MARLKLNRAGMRSLLDDTADAKCKPVAEAAAARARASAPAKSGAYRDSIEVYAVTNPTRKVWRVGSSLDYAAKIEADTGNLGRSL